MNKRIEFENFCVQHEISTFKDLEMSNYTTLKLGGPAWYVIEINNIEEIQLIKKEVERIELPMLILGNGSNVLFKDKVYEGVVLVLARNFKYVEVKGNKVVAQAGANLMDVCEVVCEHSLTGLEFAYGIPGTIGGAIYMNAGAFEGEIKDVVKEIEYLDEDGTFHKIQVTPTDFSYRKSMFTDTHKIILSVVLELEQGDFTEIRSLMDRYLQRRKDRQPLEYPSAGSVFKRPEGNYASALIDQCGLKGKMCGGAMVSEKHAGFLINYNQATSNDFIDLIEYVQQDVKNKTGYELECEVKIIANKKK
ncbi:UDP-N-acetylmuramate dehydrogenase [Anaerorhabdus furcosa]|uniref:UDP-N-acetylenolpyruvoylglucosamine reductase n=1 Tax=Anaerorhabdus furcosa TaxID=118967 RepID=A0A1T4KQ30_9FIRM|nr:UDP-N-acetylmuramate dehydrogenase [Anaerorhabdus furcosa]SJZ44510.1 UDP-N-acetylmuramate dehydrogenase [Anaerorhabdus furcosa]